MTFREYYLSLKTQERPPHPAKQFISTIADVTGRSEKTVRQWIIGLQTPNSATLAIISEKMGISKEELFPRLSQSCSFTRIGDPGNGEGSIVV